MERTYDEEIQNKNELPTSRKDVYADGMFRRCSQNRVNMFGRQQDSSLTVEESK